MNKNLIRNIDAKIKPVTVILIIFLALISSIFITTNIFDGTVKATYVYTDVDYTSFTEVDPDNEITVVNASHIDAVCDSQHDARVFKNYTAGYFDEFTYQVECKWNSRTGKNAALGIFELCDNTNDLYTQFYVAKEQGIFVYGWSDTVATTQYWFLGSCNGTTTTTDSYAATLNTWYYFTISRNATEITARIYSDKERTALLTRLRVPYISTTFKTLYALNSWNPNIVVSGDWDIQNLRVKTEVPLLFENFTTFTETDPASDIVVVNATHINATCDSSHDACVYKNYTTDYFTNFVHKINARWVSRTAKNAALSFWELSNTVDDVYTNFYINNNVSIGLYFWADIATNHVYLAEGTGASVISDGYAVTLNTWYYFNIVRNDTHIYAEIYSDNARTVLLDTLSVPYISTKFALLYGLNSWNPNIAAEGVWNICYLNISTYPSVFDLNGLSSPYGVTWEGINNSIVWCNEYLELNMSVLPSNNVTSISVFIDDLSNSIMVNASNISLYVSRDNTSYGLIDSFDDGGSYLYINKTTWNSTTMGVNPFAGAGLTDTTASIWLRFRLMIPASCPYDIFTSATTTSWEVTVNYD